MRLKTRLLCASIMATVGAAALPAGAAYAQTTAAKAQQMVLLDIPAGPASSGLNTLATQADVQIFYPFELVNGRTVPAIKGQYGRDDAIRMVAEAAGLKIANRRGDTYALEDPQGGSAGGGADSNAVDALIVTAQKREENIQDVPIAISAFSQEDLTNRQVAGGPDLITQIPNFSFTKTNFSSYSIQIRGIGTQAISATTDPAVAVAFNNTPFIRNRFFEQEFFDLERLEVLRGPQGTLYGRNATAGVVNIISAKPKFTYQAKLSADLANYSSTRIEGMVNIPLVEDAVALRIAGAWTKREGFATNQMTGQQIDGRDLWSTRVSLRFEPTDQISANLIWEHFQEDDDRLRSGKQLCKKDVVTSLGGLTVNPFGGAFGGQTYLSQGCEAVSLYSAEAFETPNGLSLPFYGPTGNVGNLVFQTKDPYLNTFQSRDLRVIESSVEPDYRANTDVVELQVSMDLTDALTLDSETAYNTDSLFSLQDYNRFTTAPGAFDPNNPVQLGVRPGLLSPDGVFCDPQLGCSDRLLLVDLSTSESSQFSQEFRLSSDFDGPINFSVGANYLRHDVEDKYYVFINSVTMFSALGPATVSYPYFPGITDNSQCIGRQGQPIARTVGSNGPGPVGEIAAIPDLSKIYSVVSCPYIDPNPIGALNDEGRNYFLSRNPYKLISYAAFSEIYYNITENLKVTGGLRWTVDRKTAPQIPSWLLASGAAGPYPTKKTVFQEWKEPTGRLAIDWKPDLSFTDDTLVYASYAHGYKAGGANPPPPVLVTYAGVGSVGSLPTNGETFDAEFVDAFEVGAKNTLLGGSLVLNATGFYYDYKGYQISQIIDRSAINSNFDAEVWGAEVEADWRVTDALRLGFKGGYEDTRLADGSHAIDLMDRTGGHDDWAVVRPFATIPSNCILPIDVLTAGGVIHAGNNTSFNGMCIDAYYLGLDPITGLPFNPSITNYATAPKAGGGVLGAAYASYQGFDPAAAPNGGRGFDKDLSGKKLPNAPKYTATLMADYTLPLPNDWSVALHGDYHYQSASWARVINSDPYDRIKPFSVVNAAAIFTNEAAGWTVMAYVKNVFDETAITGAFLNSDDSGLTTNVFLTEPRLYGIRVTKNWNGGGAWWGGDGERRPAGEPYPFTVEFGGGTSRFSGESDSYAPAWLGRYSPTFPLPAIEDERLDWGDTRQIKLTYAPSRDWSVSASYRFGRTNGQNRGGAYEAVAGGDSVTAPLGKYNRHYEASPDNHWRGAVHDAEEHVIVDFMVGRNTGLGAFGQGGASRLSAGLRYADLDSTSNVAMDGVPDRFVPPVFYPDDRSRPQVHSSQFTTTLASERGFEGVGPSVSWEAGVRLVGDDERGHADLDWSVSGGLLFGKQTLDSNEVREGLYYLGGSLGNRSSTTTTVLYNTPVPRHRSDRGTVPTLSLSLGLSYTVDRVKVSTGYSYDRFFDAIDGGYKDAQSYDRTIQGPFLKLSLGFGG